MKPYPCKPGCGCPVCDPSNRIDDDEVTLKTSLMRRELAAAKAAPEPYDALLEARRLYNRTAYRSHK